MCLLDLLPSLPLSLNLVSIPPSVLKHMEDLSVNSKNADIQARARHIVGKMKDVHFAAFCHFWADLFGILSRLSLQMQRNDIILSTIVSHLKKSMVRIECLTSRPVPDGHLAKFTQMVKNDLSFQGVVLKGSLEGTAKRGGGGGGYDRQPSV